MSAPPRRPKIYHITHVDNLPSIIAAGGIYSDASMIARGGPSAPIGMAHIKKRRLELALTCHPGDKVGEFVPFYFCARSVMLYMIFRGNDDDIKFRGGQGPIVHLEADLLDVVAWADSMTRRWAFTTSNAGAHYAEFFKDIADLNRIEWDKVSATDFRESSVKEAKFSEFLLREFFPWDKVTRIGIQSQAVWPRFEAAFQAAVHKPRVEVISSWYF